MSEEIQNNQKEAAENKAPVIQNSSSAILAAFKSELASTINSVYVNSIGRECQFKEVSVEEQKTLSKIMIENESRKDIVYDTQCALINKLCVNEGFDVYNLTEFDRIRILMEIYQNNYFKNDITYKCPECGCENKYKLDFTKFIQRFNEFNLEDVKYSTDDAQRNYTFTLNYPNVRVISNFYKSYVKKYKNTTNKEREVLDNLANVDYINLYIKQIEMVNKTTGNKTVADLSTMTYSDVEQLLSLLPQNIMFSEENGVLKYITTQFIDKINNVFHYEKCMQCGAETKEGLGSVIDFF